MPTILAASLKTREYVKYLNNVALLPKTSSVAAAAAVASFPFKTDTWKRKQRMK